MEQYNCTVVDLGDYDSKKSVLIVVNEDLDEIEISTVIDDVEIFSSGDSYLVAYQKLRDKLLELGYGLQCNGSKINAIQSGMMSQCEKIYLVEMGKKALLNQVVCIWDYADIDFFKNTNAQLEFADKWYESNQNK